MYGVLTIWVLTYFLGCVKTGHAIKKHSEPREPQGSSKGTKRTIISVQHLFFWAGVTIGNPCQRNSGCKTTLLVMREAEIVPTIFWIIRIHCGNACTLEWQRVWSTAQMVCNPSFALKLMCVGYSYILSICCTHGCSQKRIVVQIWYRTWPIISPKISCLEDPWVLHGSPLVIAADSCNLLFHSGCHLRSLKNCSILIGV